MTFDEDLTTDWSLWVLGSGLPPLPAVVHRGETVPVAYWDGPRFGAVVHVQWMWSDENPNEDYLATEVQVFARTSHLGWEVSDGEGGGHWPGPNLGSPPIGARDVHLTHLHVSGSALWRCAAASGFAGEDAAVLTIEDTSGTTRRPISSPVRAIVAAFDAQDTAVVRVLTHSGAVLFEKHLNPLSQSDKGL
jgi:hypothetical protein